MKGKSISVPIQTRMPSYPISYGGSPGPTNAGFNNPKVKDPPAAAFEVGAMNPLLSVAKVEDDSDPEYPDPSAAPMNQTFPIKPPGIADGGYPVINLGSQGV